MSGTPFFVAPEVLNNRGNQKSDIWSAGVMMYIMISSKVPFPGKTSKQILKNVLNMPVAFDHIEFIEVSSECKDLLKRMLDRNVDTRISAQEIFEHPWMKFFQNKALDSDDYFVSK